MGELFCQSANGIIDAVDNKAASKYAEYHNGRHYFVAKEGENAFLNEKPVLFVGVYCVSKGCPYENHKYSAELLPNLFELKADSSKGKVKHTPVEEERVIHKGLENNVAEGGLSAKSGSRVAHPHKRRRYGQRNDRCFYGLEPMVELNEGNHYCHYCAYVKGELIGADSAVAVRKWHNKEIGHVKSHGEIGHDLYCSVLCFVRPFSKQQRQEQG